MKQGTREEKKRKRRGSGKKMQISMALVNKSLCVNHQMKWHI